MRMSNVSLRFDFLLIVRHKTLHLDDIRLDPAEPEGKNVLGNVFIVRTNLPVATQCLKIVDRYTTIQFLTNLIPHFITHHL